MKNIFTAILLTLLVFQGFAQKQKVNYLTTFDDKLIHFGFSLGVSMLDFGIVSYNPIGENPDFVPGDWPSDPMQINSSSIVRSDLESLVPGFTVGIVSNLRLHKDFDLRFLPGMSFGERKLTYNIPVYDINAGIEPMRFISIKSTYIDFPVLIKYKARRINNDRPYVIFGSAYRQDISKTAQDDLVKLKNGGFYAEVGGGWDHYFPFFRFSVEAKFSIGLTDQLGALPQQQRLFYAQSIKSMRSNIFTLLFHFE